MNKTTLLTAALLLALGSSTHAQSLRLGNTTLGAGNASASAQRGADHIVALVNSEPITNNEVRARLARVEAPSGPDAPSREELARQVLERLIVEKTQLQWAKEIGVKVEDSALTQAEESVARQNRLTVPQLHERLKAMNVPLAQFRANLRDELLLQLVREREVDNRVRVSEQDIDAYLRDQQRSTDPSQTALNLAQVLVSVPDNASPAVVAERRAKAEDVLRRARAGEDFAALARSVSDAPEGKTAGGQLGLRPADRYPSLFLEAVQNAKAGDVVGLVRSGAGFHVLKVLEKRNPKLPETTVTQTRARHILLRPATPQDQDATIARLTEIRQRIASGQATFESQAQQFSQDGSAKQGGDLGWAPPGMFVPEFEDVMNDLAPNEISPPVVSRFGVHLIQVLERRAVPLSPREQREWVRNVLRAQKIEESYAEWARDLRARAYVEFREPPR